VDGTLIIDRGGPVPSSGRICKRGRALFSDPRLYIISWFSPVIGGFVGPIPLSSGSQGSSYFALENFLSCLGKGSSRQGSSFNITLLAPVEFIGWEVGVGDFSLPPDALGS
jgi:hypothetical protein